MATTETPRSQMGSARAGGKKLEMGPGARRSLFWILAILLMVLSIWSFRIWTTREVLRHPVVLLLEAQGWEVEHDRSFRAGWLAARLMGGMIQHPVQREIWFVLKDQDPHAIRAEVEVILFGPPGFVEPERAFGLEWERRVGDDHFGLAGVPSELDARATRVERVQVQGGPGRVHVRTFGH